MRTAENPSSIVRSIMRDECQKVARRGIVETMKGKDISVETSAEITKAGESIASLLMTGRPGMKDRSVAKAVSSLSNSFKAIDTPKQLLTTISRAKWTTRSTRPRAAKASRFSSFKAVKAAYSHSTMMRSAAAPSERYATMLEPRARIVLWRQERKIARTTARTVGMLFRLIVFSSARMREDDAE